MSNEIDRDLDWSFFEYVIAYNCTFEETFTASICDAVKLKYIANTNIRQYLGIIFDFYKKHSSLPTATEIKTYLKGDDLKAAYKDVVMQFKTLDSTYNQEELLKNTERYLKERAVYYAVKDTVDEVSSKSDIDTSLIYNRFEQACGLTLVDDLGFDYFNEIDRHIIDLQTIDRHISTGYSWLDQNLGGGLLEGGRAIYAFSGATNSGKSIVLGNVTGNIVAQNRTVVVITLEMPEMIYAKRISSKFTNIPLGQLKQEADQLKNYVIDFSKRNSGARLILKEFPPNSVNANNIKAYLTKLVQKYGIRIDAVVIDYLTLLQSIIVTGSLYADGKAVAEQIRALSYPLHFGCPFITALQANRSAYDEANPSIDTTGESIGIPQTVDFQASIWSSEAEKELGVINMGLQKSRFGPCHGKRAFRIDYDTLVITEMEDAFGNTDELRSIDSALDQFSS